VVDNRFTEVELPGGRFRGFLAYGVTRAIDGAHPWDMGGEERLVLPRGKAGSVDACGQWIQHVELSGSALLAFVHDETACDYEVGQTHKSMSLATSSDYGLTWQDEGQIITGTDPPTANKNTGEGDCTFLNGQDGYYYAYCGRTRDRAVIALRAPVSKPGPGNWTKFYEGKWDQPGLGGQATAVGGSDLGTSAARWTTTGQTLLLGAVDGGLGLYASTDHTTFKPLPGRLLVLDKGTWTRPNPAETLTYQVLLDAKTGSNQLSNAWMLVYGYWPPNEGPPEYLVFRDVEVSISASPVAAQVGVLLARWYSASLHDRWSTTAAVPGNYTSYTLDKQTGYLMTSADAATPSVELEDCASQRPGHLDHLLSEKGFCEAHGFERLRTAGWVYAKEHAQTVALYACYSQGQESHFASNAADCEGLGKMERLLGYALEP
jgi:hypothetical protein